MSSDLHSRLVKNLTLAFVEEVMVGGREFNENRAAAIWLRRSQSFRTFQLTRHTRKIPLLE